MLAVEEFDTTLKIEPRHSIALLNKGVALYEEGYFDDARKVWEHLLQIDPDSVTGQTARRNLQREHLKRKHLVPEIVKKEEMEFIYCAMCGNRMQAGDLFCMRCGAERPKLPEERILPTLAGTNGIECLSFLITPESAFPPAGDIDEQRSSFLSKLKEARSEAIKYRENFKKKAVSQLGGAVKLMFDDPIEEVLRGWHSIAIIFDWEKMDSGYGPQAMNVFFKQVKPGNLKEQAWIHFGDLIKFGTFCAIMVRSKSLKDIEYIAESFGPDLRAPGVLPHPVRFLRADSSDGNLIARTFSLPKLARLHSGKVYTNPEDGVEYIFKGGVENTEWEKIQS